MNNLLNIIGNRVLLKIVMLAIIPSYLALLFLHNYAPTVKLHNHDNYVGRFRRFLEAGYYESVAEGTTILYNVFLKAIYQVTGNLEASFFILNGTGQLFLVVFGFVFLKKMFPKGSIYFAIIAGIYVFYSLDINTFHRASNDTFLGVFVMVLLYFLLRKLFSKKNQNFTFIIIGLLLAFCLAIRLTAILLIPLVLYAFITWYIKDEGTAAQKIMKISMSFLVFIVTTAALHYPSLKEKGTLSYEDKNPKNSSANWTQRNYLGLKKIENGEARIHRDAIWKHTKFEEVETYLETNGKESLPGSLVAVIKMDPILLLKMTAYNVAYSVLRFFRFWSLFFIVLLIPLINIKKLKKNIFSETTLPSFLFVIFMLSLSFLSFTFMEFRWFFGYEILVPLAILSQIDKIKYFNNSLIKNAFFTVSLVIILMFNLRSIIGLL